STPRGCRGPRRSASAPAPRRTLPERPLRPGRSRRSRGSRSRPLFRIRAGRGGRRDPRSVLRLLDDRPDLDRAEAGSRDPGRRLDRLVEVLAFDQEVSPQLLLRLGERSVGAERLVAPNAYRRGRPRGVELVAPAHPALLGEPGRVLVVLLVHRLSLLGAGRLPRVLVAVDQQHVF